MLHDVTSYLIVQCVLKAYMANSCGSQDSMGREKSHQLFVDKGKRLDDGEECVSVDRVLADICEKGSRPYTFAEIIDDKIEISRECYSTVHCNQWRVHVEVCVLRSLAAEN